MPLLPPAFASRTVTRSGPRGLRQGSGDDVAADPRSRSSRTVSETRSSTTGTSVGGLAAVVEYAALGVRPGLAQPLAQAEPEERHRTGEADEGQAPPTNRR